MQCHHERWAYGLVVVASVFAPVVAPVAKGSELGEVEIRLGDEVVATRLLVAVDEVEKGSWWRRILDSLLMLIWG